MSDLSLQVAFWVGSLLVIGAWGMSAYLVLCMAVAAPFVWVATEGEG